jgi:ATP-binding cassette subfamily B protein/subfamily B ATP-binding cassette protein MsbA
MTEGLRRYKRLMSYARPYGRGWASIFFLTLFSTLFALLQPWPMKALVDNVLNYELRITNYELSGGGIFADLLDWLPGADTPRGLLVWVVAAGVGIFLVNSLLDVALTFSWIRVGQRMVYDLAADLFAKVQRKSLIFHTRSSVGDLMGRIAQDSWSVHTLADALLFTPAQALITVVGAVVLMLGLNRDLTLVTLAVVPVMVGASLFFGRPIRVTMRHQRKMESRIQSHVQRVLRGIRVVQAFAQEDRERRHFRELTRAVIRAEQRSTLIANLYRLNSGLITTLGTALVLWIGARHVLAGTFTLGGFLVFLAYLNLLQTQLKALAGTFSTLQKANAGVERVVTLLDTQGPELEVPEKQGAMPLPPVEGHVLMVNVSFGYAPDKPVLQDVYLEALPGQSVALAGPSGVGKSTLANLVPRFFDPDEGNVYIDGYDIRDVQLKSLRDQIAIVLQEPFLFPVSVAENIAYGQPGATRQQIERAARAANAHDFIMQLPRGYDTVLGEHGATLSGGEQQRIAIARALLKNAPILILDEPTSALDAETEQLIMDALQRLMQGRTTFIIAHRLSTIRSADKIALLRDGRLVEVGTHHELLALNGLYSQMYNTHTVSLPSNEVVAVG